jgi:AraC-like DNA-binding protein
MTIQISDIVPIIIVFQSTLFAVVLLTDKGPKRISNRYLSAFLVTLGLQFFAITIFNLNYESDFLASSVCVYGFIYGPILLFYTRTLVYKTYHFSKSQLIHFIPATTFLLFGLINHSLCSPFGVLLYLSLFTYISLAVREIIAYRKVVKGTQSSNAQIDLKWLQWTIIIFSFSLFLDLVNQFLVSLYFAGISTIHLALLILINWMFYKGLKQPQIFLGISKTDEILASIEKISTSSTLPSQEEDIELERIKQYMHNSKIFTNAELSLAELASNLEIQPRRLSYLINNFLDQNFVGFVNYFRIEMAKERLKNVTTAGETILEIMYEVGFNSKSSFNTIFKQYTGLTPTEFRKRHK